MKCKCFIVLLFQGEVRAFEEEMITWSLKDCFWVFLLYCVTNCQILLTGRIKNIANMWNSCMSLKHSTIPCTSMLPHMVLYFVTLLSLAPDRLDIIPLCRNGYLTLMPGNLLECPTGRWWGDSILRALSLSLNIYCIGQEWVINLQTNLCRNTNTRKLCEDGKLNGKRQEGQKG